MGGYLTQEVTYINMLKSTRHRLIYTIMELAFLENEHLSLDVRYEQKLGINIQSYLLTVMQH